MDTVKIISIKKVVLPRSYDCRKDFRHCLRGTLEVSGRRTPFMVTYLHTDGSIKKDRGRVYAHLTLREFSSAGIGWRRGGQLVSQSNCPHCEQISLDLFIPHIEAATGKKVARDFITEAGWDLVDAWVPSTFKKDRGYERRGEDVVVFWQEFEGVCPLHGRISVIEQDVAD